MKISNINISIKFNANNKSKLATTNDGSGEQRMELQRLSLVGKNPGL